MDLSNSRRQNTGLPVYAIILKRFLLCMLILFSAWVPQAFAISGCTIDPESPFTATVAPFGTQTFSVLLTDQNSGFCTTPATLTFSIESPPGDTTGGVTLPATIASAPFTFPGTSYSFNVQAGGTGNGSVQIRVTCSNCSGGSNFVIYTLNTSNNVYSFTPTSPTTVTTNQSKPFTLATNLLVNGLGSGTTYSTQFFITPSGPFFGPFANTAAGDASYTSQISSSGTYNFAAGVVCPTAIPGCPPPSIPFTVVVEPVAVTAVSPTTDSIISGGTSTPIARYGGTTSVVNAGYTINWAIISGPGSGVLSGITTTNPAGQSQVTFTATTAGVYVVRASTTDTWASDSFEDFTITVAPVLTCIIFENLPTSATVLPGTPQVFSVGLQDVGSSGCTPADLTFSVVGPDTTGGVILPAPMTGIAYSTSVPPPTNFSVTAGGTGGGSATIQVNCSNCVNGQTTAQFTLNTVNRTLAISSGNNQTGPTNGTLPLILLIDVLNDGLGAPDGTVINWLVTSGDASVPATSLSSGGQASVLVNLGPTPGPITISATRADDASATVSFNATSTLTRTLSVYQGDGQTGPINTSLSSPIEALAMDNGVNVADGSVINWAVTSGDATLGSTSSITLNGVAATTVNLGLIPGPITITATRADDASISTVFTATSTGTLNLAVSSGNNQTGPIGGSLPAPLAVLVQNDSFNAPDGTVVNWLVVSGDASVAATSTTTGGIASMPVSLGPTAGPIQISATRADNSAATFTFNATSILVRTLAISSGNNQSGLSTTSLAQPLVVLAQDSGSNAPDGTVINWLVSSGDATVAATSTTTNGLASVTANLGMTAGPIIISATRADDSTATVNFNATLVLAQLAPFSGAGQSGPTSSTLPLPVVFRATNDGSPVSGVGITWSVVGDATLSAVSATTDLSGLAQATVNFGPTPGAVTINAQRNDSPGASASIPVTSVLNRTLTIDFGNGQSGIPTSQLQMQVIAADNGTPVNGLNIDWLVTSGDATLTSSTSATNALGQAFTYANIGPSAGPRTVTVSATRSDDSSVVQNFTLNILAAPVLNLFKTAGDGQTAPTNTTLGTALEVEAQNDTAPVSGKTINWSVVSGDATLSVLVNPTNAAGRSSASVSFGATPGPIQIRAERADDTSVFTLFNLTSTLTRTLTIVSGDGTNGASNALLPIVVNAADNGTGVAGVIIDWAVVSGDASVAATSTTIANGNASIDVVLGTTQGPVQVTGTRADNPAATVTFNLNNNGSPTLTLVSGDGQAGYGGQTSGPLVVRLLDGTGAPMVGQSITWAGAVAGTTITDGNGFSSNTVSFAGSGFLDIVASYIPATLEVHFNLQAIIASLGIVSGNGQAGETGTALAFPLVVLAEDDVNPAVGIPVIWTVDSGDAIVTSNTGSTDGNGEASANITLGPAAGPIQITAQRNDGSGKNVQFNLSSAVVLRSLLVSSGNNQSGPINSTLASPLVVIAQNNGVNAPDGTIINWAVTSGSGTVASGTSTTTAGLANMTLTLGATTGPVTITATRADNASAIVTFTATSVIQTLTVVSGNNQTAAPNASLPAPLVVLAQNDGIGVSGVSINWSVSGNATVTPNPSITDATGHASVTVMLGNIVLNAPNSLQQEGTKGVFVSAPITITASRADDPSGTVLASFTITATLTRTLVVSSGNNQTAPTGTVIAPLVVLAQDNGVNAANIAINWSTTGGTLSSASSLTNAAGLGSIDLTLPAAAGPVTVTATRADDGTAIATFTATATLVRTLVIVSGDNQNAPSGSSLPSPVVVEAKDNGNPVSGVGINWSITAGSTLGVAVNTTGVGGTASNTATLGNTPGVVTITAARQDDPTVSVTFTVNGIKLADIPNLTPAQRELATALDNACASLNGVNSPNPLQIDFIARCQELVDNAVTNPADVVAALQALLPSSQAAQARAAMLTASQQFETINARIAALRSGTQGTSFGGLALVGGNGSISLGSLINGLTGESATPEVGADFQRWGFFASGTIGSGDANAAGITPSFDFDIHSLTVGVDYRQSDKFIFGAAIGFTNQDTDLAPGQGGVDASGYTLSAYSTYFKDNSWYTDAVLTFGKNNYDLVRRINYSIPDGLGGITTVDQTARSDSGGDMLSFGATFGRDFQKGGWSIGPYGRLLYTRMNFDQIKETLITSGPGAGLGLIVEERSLDSLATILGGKFTRAISTNWGVLTPHFQFEWEHEFNSDPGAVTARFINDPTGTEIVLSDEPYDSDFYRIGVGLSAIMSKGRSGFLYYEKTIGRDGISQDNLALGFRLEF